VVCFIARPGGAVNGAFIEAGLSPGVAASWALRSDVTARTSFEGANGTAEPWSW
jgi:hypothetical protein